METIYSKDEVITNGVDSDELLYKLHDERMYIDEQREFLFSGIAYSLYKNGALCDYELYEDGWGKEYYKFYPSGAIWEHAIYYHKSVRRKQEMWHENGQRKRLAYYSSGVLIAQKCWDEDGSLKEKMVWNDGRKIGGLLFCGGKTMEREICSGKMTEAECFEMQLYLQRFIMQEQVMDLSDIHTIAGIDLAYWEEAGKEFAVCCIVLVDAKTHDVLERVHQKGLISFPYIPGYLAFRELPLILETAKLLKTPPDVYMFDGNGILHPRKMGIATQASIFLKRPTLGVAKSYYKVESTDYTMPDNEPGAYTDIVVSENILGRALRTHRAVKPVFISVGNYMSLEGVTELVLQMVGKQSHIPIPTWEADQDTHKMRKIYGGC